LWLPFIGFDPIMILTQISINLIFQFWVHTKMIKKMPAWFEYIFNTPSHHRVHHASNVQYLDKNHAGTLVIWDRMFGTFMPEKEEVVYGITNKYEEICTIFFDTNLSLLSG
jgi:sterol desaturase/sphingolipid hydroxylase (fatty acid hydroxylase superfamily)